MPLLITIQSGLEGIHLLGTVKRGTGQSGVLMFWLIVMDKFLGRLKRIGVKVVAYAGNLVMSAERISSARL